MSESFESPTLPLEELLSFFEDNEFEINKNDFLRPDPRRWRTIFSHLFERLTSRPIEQAIQALCQILNTEHREIYEEGFAQMAFTLCMQRVFCNCGFSIFPVEDVISPTKPRLIRMLSAFVNFYHHLSLRQDVFQEERQSLERSREQYDAVKNKQKELRSNIERKEECRAQRESEKIQLEDEYNQGEHRVQELKKHQEILQKDVKNIQLVDSEKEKEKESNKQKIADIQQEADKLSQKIVNSPDRFKQEQDRLKKKYLEMKEEFSRKEQMLSEDKRLLEKTNHKKLASEKAVKLSQEVQENLENENKTNLELQKLTERNKELIDQINQRYKSKEGLFEKINVRKEQRQGIFVQTDVNNQDKLYKHTELKQLIEKFQERIKTKKLECEELGNSEKMLHRKMNELVQNAEKVDREWEEECNGSLDEIAKINQQHKEFMNILRTTINNAKI